MWFQTGADGVFGVGARFKVGVVAKCPKCKLADGVTAPDGNAWFIQKPRIGGFVRITPTGKATKFFAGERLATMLTAGPGGMLWGLLRNVINEYSTLPKFVRAFPVGITPDQSGIAPIGGALYWTTFAANPTNGNELYFVGMTYTGDFEVLPYSRVGKCDTKDRQFFTTTPARGGDGYHYVGVGCSPDPPPFTTRGLGYIVRF